MRREDAEHTRHEEEKEENEEVVVEAILKDEVEVPTRPHSDRREAETAVLVAVAADEEDIPIPKPMVLPSPMDMHTRMHIPNYAMCHLI